MLRPKRAGRVARSPAWRDAAWAWAFRALWGANVGLVLWSAWRNQTLAWLNLIMAFVIRNLAFPETRREVGRHG